MFVAALALLAETDGIVFFAGLKNGETLGVDIRTRSAVFSVDRLAGSILSCAATSTPASMPMLFTGSEDGLFAAWDLRVTKSPLHAVSSSSSPITSIVVSRSDSLSVWTAHGDGVCCKWSNVGDKPHISTTLTGQHYDAVCVA
ncbi:hypothetical protein PsorP6_002270 [Peronosclerospora sorghi]|uniref:Uncharacterized protein n=1 Tax=Peronosclerospora sorghi TaxID=230839 RepID=A0ACC0WYK1_9STRA|nr:hypothetical protein PsorP6_002270 [Peronosclerospora sorghi]